jgi:ribonuclease-3 family protein
MIIPVINGDIREVSPSVLAYVGDAVFELYIRLHVAARKVTKSGTLHKQAIMHVRAEAQANAARILLPELSEDESTIFRRAKNSNPISMAKNASPADYKYATGLEAVIGYLYLTDQKERLDYLLLRIITIECAIEKGEIDVHGS